MKNSINPGVAAVIVIVVVVIAVFFLYRSTGARTDGPSQPVDMGKAVAVKGGPSTGGGAGH